jgi:hypothetical protein
VRDARRQRRQRAGFQPALQQIAHRAPSFGFGEADAQVRADELDGAFRPRHHQDHLGAVQRQGFAGLAENGARPAGRLALVELLQDPARLLLQEAFDLAPGRAQRRRDRQALARSP